MRKFFRNLNLNARLNLSIAGLLLIFLSTFGIYIYQTQKQRMINETEEQMALYLNDIDYIINQELNTRKKVIRETANYMTHNMNVKQLRDSIPIEVNAGHVIGELMKQFNQDEFIRGEIRKYFENKLYKSKKAIEPFLIYKTGIQYNVISGQANNISETNLYNTIKYIGDHKIHKVKYNWPEGEDAEKRYMFLKYLENYNAYITLASKEKELFSSLYQLRNIILAGIATAIILLAFSLHIIVRRITQQIVHLAEVVQSMCLGIFNHKISFNRNDELGVISESLNHLTTGLTSTAEFSKQIGQGNLDAEFEPLSEEDDLGNSLLEMRRSLKEAKSEREKQQQQEQERTWSTTGHAKFADILRYEENDIYELSFKVISELVEYLDALAGGIFLYTEDENKSPWLEMTACFAYDRRKFIKKKLATDEGLIGTCFKEKETIYMSEVPEGYMDISSGMGDTDPGSILIIPLKVNEDIYGVIELASLEKIANYKIAFAEKTGEMIASTISTVRNNIKTSELLHQFQEQSEEMKSKEEELRQNMEELQATQEDADRREAVLQGKLDAINQAVAVVEMNLNGSIQNINEAFSKLSGLNLAECHGKSISEYIDISQIKEDAFRKILNKVSEGEPYNANLNFVFRNKDILAHLSIAPTKDEKGAYNGLLAMMIHLPSAKKKTQKAEEKNTDKEEHPQANIKNRINKIREDLKNKKGGETED